MRQLAAQERYVQAEKKNHQKIYKPSSFSQYKSLITGTLCLELMDLTDLEGKFSI